MIGQHYGDGIAAGFRPGKIAKVTHSAVEHVCSEAQCTNFTIVYVVATVEQGV
jgi:hypothetical protein